MNVLTFEPEAVHGKRRRLRRAAFERKSLLPLSAACAVANGIRETLSRDLGRSLSVRLLPPVLPRQDAWNELLDGALLYRVRGGMCDAALVLRPGDALALASTIFGEPADTAKRSLSVLERRMLAKAARSLCVSLAHVCGRDVSEPETVAAIDGYTTYFELLVDDPAIRLGVALSHEKPAGGAPLTVAHLSGVRIETSARMTLGRMPARAILELREGDYVPLDVKRADLAYLVAGKALLAQGVCGAVGGWSALKVTQR